MTSRPTTPPPSNDKQPESSVDLTTPAASSAPSMPHERDEASGMTGGVPSKRVQQGHRDLERGVEDTTRGTEADKAYKRQKT